MNPLDLPDPNTWSFELHGTVAVSMASQRFLKTVAVHNGSIMAVNFRILMYVDSLLSDSLYLLMFIYMLFLFLDGRLLAGHQAIRPATSGCPAIPTPNSYTGQLVNHIIIQSLLRTWMFFFNLFMCLSFVFFPMFFLTELGRRFPGWAASRPWPFPASPCGPSRSGEFLWCFLDVFG